MINLNKNKIFVKYMKKVEKIKGSDFYLARY